MYSVDLYARVRRAVVVEGISIREAARRFGIHRDTVSKMLSFSIPPGYRRKEPPRKPKIGPFTAIIDQILEEDLTRPKKQRHTAQRIFERLREEHGFTGGHTIVKDYVRERKLVAREMFIPLTHKPGHAQVDFGEALAVIGGVERKVHLFVMDLPYSDACFVKAYPAETTEAFLDGHVSAFAFFGGVPQSVLYDNTTLAVGRILGHGKRQRTRAFTELISHYLFTDRFGRPGKGNDKGKVENLVGFARRSFLVPVPRCGSFEGLNELLKERSLKRRADRLRGHAMAIGDRLAADQEAFLPLADAQFEACDKQPARVSSLSLVRYKSNDYSVPVRYGHQEVIVKGYVHEVAVCRSSEEIARHKRSYDKEDFVFDPLHYLPLLDAKPGALDQAAPLVDWELPEEFTSFLRLLTARLGASGKREYVQVLRLLETFRLDEVAQALRDALSLSAISFDAVKHLLLGRLEGRPARLDLALYPHLPKAWVETTKAGAYAALLTGVAR